MKVLGMLVLCGVINLTWQFPNSNLTSNSQSNLPTSTTTSSDDKCNGIDRKWTFCFGNPPVRNTSDNCTKRTEPCTSGTILGGKFIKSFTPSNMRNVRAMLPYANHIVNGTYHVTDPFNPLVKLRIDFSSILQLLSDWSQENVISPKRDLLLMIDESGSIGGKSFVTLKNIVCAIAKLLCGKQQMSLDKTRVAVMSFDSMSHLHVPLQHPTIPELNSDARFLADYVSKDVKYNKYTQGGTCLNDALGYARDVALSHSMGGRRFQTNVIQEIVLITDGCQNCINSESLEFTLEQLRKDGIKLYVIGLSIPHKCEATLQLLEKSGHCVHLFQSNKWSEDLEDFIKVLENPPLVDGRRLCLYPQYDENKQCLPQHGM